VKPLNHSILWLFFCATCLTAVNSLPSAISGREMSGGENSSAKAAVVESGYIEVDGGRIFYEAAGQGPTFIMTHDGLLHLTATTTASSNLFAPGRSVICSKTPRPQNSARLGDKSFFDRSGFW